MDINHDGAPTGPILVHVQVKKVPVNALSARLTICVLFLFRGLTIIPSGEDEDYDYTMQSNSLEGPGFGETYRTCHVRHSKYFDVRPAQMSPKQLDGYFYAGHRLIQEGLRREVPDRRLNVLQPKLL